ncbi:MAG: helix-turn-helix domain-containing protein [Chitinophagaceae bacterium]
MTPTHWIKKLRLYKEFKQATVAQRMGISQQAYSKMENSSWVAKGKLPAILQALESNPEELKKVAQLFREPIWEVQENICTVG